MSAAPAVRTTAGWVGDDVYFEEEGSLSVMLAKAHQKLDGRKADGCAVILLGNDGATDEIYIEPPVGKSLADTVVGLQEVTDALAEAFLNGAAQ